MLRAALASFTLLLASSSASAGTIVVDAQRRPGFDFDDLPAAVAAALPGDVVLVHTGVYREIVVDKQLTLLGVGAGALVDGAIVVRGVERRVAIAALSARSLVIEDCTGCVSAERMPALERVRVHRARDVRLHELRVVAAPGSGDAALETSRSRVELASSELTGAVGEHATASTSVAVVDGAPALRAGSGSRVHLARTSAFGGAGGSQSLLHAPGNGAAALRVECDAVLFVSGDGATILEGGAGGRAVDPSGAHDGAPGLAIEADDAALVTWSLAELRAGATRAGVPSAHGSAATTGAYVTASRTAQPTITVTGWPLAGGALLVHVRGEPLARVRFWYGRKTTLHPFPDGGVEWLARALVAFELGNLPPSGSLSFVLPVSPSYATGTLFTCQAETKDALTSARQRSNSLPLIVR